MKQTIEIEVPEGKKAIWKDGKVIFEDIKSRLPKTWEEFCEQNSVKSGEYYIDAQGDILKSGWKNRDMYEDKNVLPNQKAAEQHLALMQLHQLRNCYREGWLPDGLSSVYNIERYYDPSNGVVKFRVIKYYSISKFLSFQTEEKAKEFLNNFRDLIEKAWDLI